MSLHTHTTILLKHLGNIISHAPLRIILSKLLISLFLKYTYLASLLSPRGAAAGWRPRTGKLSTYRTWHWLGMHQPSKKIHKQSINSWQEGQKEIAWLYIRTLYSTTHTKILRGMRKKFIMVLLASSGMYWDLIFIMDGQNIPTQASKTQNPTNWMQPEKEMLPPFTWDGSTKNCFRIQQKQKERMINWKLNDPWKYNWGGKAWNKLTLVTIGRTRDAAETTKTICI